MATTNSAKRRKAIAVLAVALDRIEEIDYGGLGDVLTSEENADLTKAWGIIRDVRRAIVHREMDGEE